MMFLFVILSLACEAEESISTKTAFFALVEMTNE